MYVYISYRNKVSMTTYREFIKIKYNFLEKYHIFRSENTKTRSALNRSLESTEGTESYRWV